MKKMKCENCGEPLPNHVEGTSQTEGELRTEEKVKKSDAEIEKAKIEEVLNLSETKDQQIADLSDKFMRLAAEYDNFRRRSQKEKDSLYIESIASVAAAWIPVVDNLERAILVSSEFQQEEAQKIKAGVDMVLQQAKDAMSSLGILEIEALNSKFDPNSMEAIMHVDDENFGESQVVEVFEKGYKRGEKIIRHAVVKVAN